MKAAFIEQTGDPDVIQYADLPDPTPGPGEVLVKVGAVSVNPIDTYIRSGAVKLELKFPYIIGCDLAGTVVAVGDQVQRFKTGDRVWGSNQSLMGRQGSFSELAAVDEQWLYPTPDNMTDEQAAAAALVGITAHLGLFLHGRLQPGEVVFVGCNVDTHPLLVSSRVLAESPPDGLPDEEVRVGKVRCASVTEQGRVRFSLVTQLADDACAPEPEVVIENP